MALKARKTNDYSTRNKIELIEGGRPYFDLLAEVLRHAQRTLYFQTYIFNEDETGRPIIDALIAAAQRGVHVFLLLDGYASQGLSEESITSFKKAGIHFRFFEPLLKSKGFYFGRRLHHKVVVIDSSTALVSGINVDNKYNDTAGQSAWLDWALYIRGELGFSLEAECKKRMKYVRAGNGSPARDEFPQSYHQKARVRVNDWVSGKRQISRSFLEMLRTATSSVIIMSPYFLPGNEFKKQMAHASKRGVKIRVLLAGVSDITVAKWAERYVYQWLLDHGVEIYEYQKNVLHGKIAVRDEHWLTAGSYNVNNLSAYASIELNVDVDDASLAKKARAKLESIIRDDCVRITREHFKQQNHVVKKVVQWMCYELLRFLLFLTTFYFRSKE